MSCPCLLAYVTFPPPSKELKTDIPVLPGTYPIHGVNVQGEQDQRDDAHDGQGSEAESGHRGERQEGTC